MLRQSGKGFAFPDFFDRFDHYRGAKILKGIGQIVSINLLAFAWEKAALDDRPGVDAAIHEMKGNAQRNSIHQRMFNGAASPNPWQQSWMRIQYSNSGAGNNL